MVPLWKGTTMKTCFAVLKAEYSRVISTTTAAGAAGAADAQTRHEIATKRAANKAYKVHMAETERFLDYDDFLTECFCITGAI